MNFHLFRYYVVKATHVKHFLGQYVRQEFKFFCILQKSHMQIGYQTQFDIDGELLTSIF